MLLKKVQKIKKYEYKYDNKEEMNEHLSSMITAGFTIEHTYGLNVDYSVLMQEGENSDYRKNNISLFKKSK